MEKAPEQVLFRAKAYDASEAGWVSRTAAEAGSGAADQCAAPKIPALAHWMGCAFSVCRRCGLTLKNLLIDLPMLTKALPGPKFIAYRYTVIGNAQLQEHFG